MKRDYSNFSMRQVSDGEQRTSEIQVAHVENEIEVKAANIVRLSHCHCGY